MVDALYPILGGMVSKYVAQAIKKLMESVNQQIEQGLSLKRYKRKAKALFTGVSEAELILEEASDAHILALFVLQKESALLIAEAQLKESIIGDPHMVASMASAIKDFISDWVASSEEPKEVQIMSYSNITLYIESAGSVYLIAFLDTEPDFKVRESINGFFAALVGRYSTFFQKFDGDDAAPEVQKITDEMHTYLHNQTTLDEINFDAQKTSTIKYVLVGLGVLLLLYISYKGYENYKLYALEEKIFQETGYRVTFETQEGALHLLGSVKSFEDEQKIREIIEKASDLSIKNELRMKLPDIATILKEQRQSIDSNTTQKIKTLENEISNFRSMLLNKLYLEEKLIASIYETFDNRRGIVVQENGSLDFSDLKLFDAGSVTLNESDRETIKEVFESYTHVLLSNPEIRPFIKAIIIEGHTDSLGSVAMNQRISLKRAMMVKEYILSLDIAQTYPLPTLLHAQGIGSKELIFVNGKEDKEASRRIKIKFVLDKLRLFQTIKKML